MEKEIREALPDRIAYCQHHWHASSGERKRVPLNYCAVKGEMKVKTSDTLCKMRYPRPLNSTNKVICEGNCKQDDGKCSGRRSMLGKVATLRIDSWFSETSAVLAATVNAKTSVQVPYRSDECP